MVFCNIRDALSLQKGDEGHNPYFSRWFSAIQLYIDMCYYIKRHNPYFSRWFSAMSPKANIPITGIMSQSLF